MADDMFPSENKFKALIKQVIAAESDKNESVGRMGSLISNAVEKDHLHKKAFANIMRERRMSPSKLRDLYAHERHYRTIAGLYELADQQTELVDPAEVSPALEPKKRGRPPKNVKAKPAREPRPGSFAEKMQQASDIPRAAAAVVKRAGQKGPSPEEVQAIADRAEQGGKPH